VGHGHFPSRVKRGFGSPYHLGRGEAEAGARTSETIGSSSRPIIILLDSLTGIVKEGDTSVDVSVIIEAVAGSGYRAIGAGGLSLGLSAEGATAAEAIDRLAEQVRMRVNAGARLADMKVAAIAAIWKQDAGCLKDDPMYGPSREAMEDYRRQLDKDPETL
jgi:hypothetical protein